MNVYFKNGSSFTSIYDLIYPVGSVFIANTWSFNAPAQFGGSWENPPDGLVYGTSTSYNVGTHQGGTAITLSWDNMPSHNHQMPIHRNGKDSGVNDTSRNGGLIAYGHDGNVGYGGNVMLFNSDGLEDSNWTTYAGNGTGFDVLPSLSRNEFHVWRRIS